MASFFDNARPTWCSPALKIEVMGEAEAGEGRKEEKESGERVRESEGGKEGRKERGREEVIDIPCLFFLCIITAMFSGL